MKNFILALFGLISQTVLRVWDRIQSGEGRQMATDGFRRLKSLFAGYDEERPLWRRPAVLLAASGAVILTIACIRLFTPSKPDMPSLKKLGAPEMRTADGDLWTLQLMKGQSSVVVRDSKSGPPLFIRTEAQAYGNRVTVGVHLEGQAGEKYVPGALKNGAWEPAPRFQLVGENGQVLAAGHFEYG
ncbi:MAG: hypothetical protein IH624_10465 [Phycisphaerae bacterium]|nr:hypothetical protein [Phycisphaerae bacterium]